MHEALSYEYLADVIEVAMWVDPSDGRLFVLVKQLVHLEFRLDQLQTLMAERVSICTGVPVKQVR